MFFKEMSVKKVSKWTMKAANHNFTVAKKPLFIRGIKGNIPDQMAVVNEQTGQYLGTVGTGWEPVQPKVLYDLAKELIKSTGGMINGAINMFNGSLIGLSFNLANREYVSGDPINLNFLMATSFNGTHALNGHATINRIVCLNQCNTSNKVYSLKHTRFINNRIKVVKNMLKYYNDEIKLFDEKMMHLVNKRMDSREAEIWFRSLFPLPKKSIEENKKSRAEKYLDEQTSIFLDCLENGKGSDITGVRGTYYGAFQALTEYINHYRMLKIHKIDGEKREEDEVRFQSIHFGVSNALTQKGLTKLSDTKFNEFSEDEFMIK